MVSHVSVLVYALVAYALFLATFLYTIGFVAGFATPTRLDGPADGPVAAAMAIDLGLLALFALQHSGMARPGFKRWLTRFVPAAAERATYVLLSSLALAALFALWRPVGGVVWEVRGEVARAAGFALAAAGWLTVLATTFLIHHFDLFGLRQAWLHFRGRPYTPVRFATPLPYRLVRHPLYVGWLLAFWAAPTRSRSSHRIAAYRRRVPMLVPRLTGSGRPAW